MGYSILILQYFEESKMSFGIEAIELYVPNTYVEQTELETYNQVSKGKYTLGLGQHQLSFSYPFEDVNSIALTVVNNLLRKHNISPSQVGRLEVGTETLTDKSKSTKTVLMSLFQGHHDIEGATSVNACYGATNALLNTLNWISSPSWDGRYGIVVAADVAVYEDGPARPTGGAGAVAMLISNRPKISFSPIRSTFIDHQYDFYKPLPGSEYPVVDGKLSIECYLRAVRECYSKLKEKTKNDDIIQNTDFFCFHCPYFKMVQKAFTHLLKTASPNITDEQIKNQFKLKVEPSLSISQRIGNIYTGSLYACLYSLLYKNPQLANKKVVLFSYGSGLCSSMLQVNILSNPLSSRQIEETTAFFNNRTKIDVKTYTAVMLQKEQNYGKWKGKVEVNQALLSDNVFYLSEIDEKWRRRYSQKASTSLKLSKDNISYNDRIKTFIDKKVPTGDVSKFYKLNIGDRRNALEQMANCKVNDQSLQNGGLTSFCADKMIENVIGKLALPLGVIPSITINHKRYSIPMCIEEPSVVAATSSIGKFINPYTFTTSSSPSIMMGQVFLPSAHSQQIHSLLSMKEYLIEQLNEYCPSMAKRNGGVKDIRLRNLDNKVMGGNDYSFDILIDVKEAMGANIINTLSEKAKQIISSMGIRTGISILTNYCMQRRATSSFIIPVQHMAWKGYTGLQVAHKIMEAYQFAMKDTFRAVTHNKGIMNGIDAVCLATGQDWRALESGAHAYAARNGRYEPLTHYRVFQKEGSNYFQGKIELPIAVGTVGGAIMRNPLYKSSLTIMGTPSAQELSQIMVTVGLAQNFAALRALAIEGIQKGHMSLHSRAIASSNGVPPHLIEQCCQFMTRRHKYDKQTVQLFLQYSNRPHL